MITALKFLFYMTFATFQGSKREEVRVMDVEVGKEAVEMKIEIEDIKMPEKGELQQDVLELRVQPKLEVELEVDGE